MMDKLMNNKPKLMISFSGCSKKDDNKQHKVNVSDKPATVQGNRLMNSDAITIRQTKFLPTYKFS